MPIAHHAPEGAKIAQGIESPPSVSEGLVCASVAAAAAKQLGGPLCGDVKPCELCIEQAVKRGQKLFVDGRHAQLETCIF